MACYHPIQAFTTPTGVVFDELRRHDITGTIELPCGQCVGCRMRRASDWELRVMHEAHLWPDNCFVTLTYRAEALPANGNLVHRDFQLFMKRLRKSRTNETVRFYMCGEYGPLNARPHYHACIFNEGFRELRKLKGKSASGAAYYENPRLNELWTHGNSTVQDLNNQTASYCARYVMKKALGQAGKHAYESVTEDGEIIKRKAEYSAMSLKPGIGAKWLDKYHSDVYPLDAVITRGKERRPPKYYDRRYRTKINPLGMEQLDQARIERARLSSSDNTDERRAVRETVHLARVANLKRTMK